jgi:hypothetical protein
MSGKTQEKVPSEPRSVVKIRLELLRSLLKSLRSDSTKKEDESTRFSYYDEDWAKYSNEAKQGKEYDDPLDEDKKE